MDILIYAKPEKILHKFCSHAELDNFAYCYWTGKLPNNKNLFKINKIYFSDGSKIYAEGKFSPSLTQFDRALCFRPLIKVNLKQPKKPPTRGWCYINK